MFASWADDDARDNVNVESCVPLVVVKSTSIFVETIDVTKFRLHTYRAKSSKLPPNYSNPTEPNSLFSPCPLLTFPNRKSFSCDAQRNVPDSRDFEICFYIPRRCSNGGYIFLVRQSTSLVPLGFYSFQSRDFKAFIDGKRRCGPVILPSLRYR